MLKNVRKLFIGHKHPIIILIVIGCVLLSAFIYFKQTKPPLLEKYTFSTSFFLKDNTLARLIPSYDDKYRLFIPLEEIPQEMQEAVLLYEDKYFYKHFGVNFLSVIRAFKETYLKQDRRIGASTITMQTARIIFNLNTKNALGKIKQIFYAFYLELFYSKQEILEAYLNIAPYGYNIEGVGAASLIYFHKRVQDLVLNEMLTLAVIPQNPNKRRPSTPQGYKEMSAVKEILFKNWIQKYPQDAKSETFLKIKSDIFSTSDLPFYIPHVINYLHTHFSQTEVFTSLDLQIQQKIENYVKQFVNKKKKCKYTQCFRNFSKYKNYAR